MFNLKNILKNLKKTLSDLALMICRCSSQSKIIKTNTPTVCHGDSATIYASGNPCPSNYQWQELINGVWTNIEGANSNSYTTETLMLVDNGSGACLKECQSILNACYEVCYQGGGEICYQNCELEFNACFETCPVEEANNDHVYRLITNYNKQCSGISNELIITVAPPIADITCSTPIDCSLLDDCGCGWYDGFGYCPPGIPGIISPTIQLTTCNNCNVLLGGSISVYNTAIVNGWQYLTTNPSTGLPTSFVLFNDLCQDVESDGYLECWTEYVFDLQPTQDCFSICDNFYNDCYNLCDPEDIECQLECSNTSDSCHNECIASVPFIPQVCSQIPYYAILTIDGEFSEYQACGSGGISMREVSARFEDSLGNTQTCTIYFYDIAC